MLDDVRRERELHIDDPDEEELLPPTKDIEDILDVDSDDESLLLPLDPVTTVTSGPLTLNPKVDENPLVPLCPACEEPIERVEAPSGGPVEFRCGCDELRYFEFPERKEAESR